MIPPPISFIEKVINLVESNCAASITAGGFDFLEKLYALYKSQKCDDAWLTSYLKDQFQCVANKPLWLEREPAWPFCEGKPMLFIGQFSIGENHHTIAGSGYTVYFFVGRKERNDGFELEFREIVQSEAIAQIINKMNPRLNQ